MTNIVNFGKPTNTYPYHICCPNCYIQTKLEIKKGVLVAEELETFKCPNCGCTAEQFVRKQQDIAKKGGLLRA